MCEILGVIVERPIADILIKGLKRLELCCYD